MAFSVRGISAIQSLERLVPQSFLGPHRNSGLTYSKFRALSHKIQGNSLDATKQQKVDERPVKADITNHKLNREALIEELAKIYSNFKKSGRVTLHNGSGSAERASESIEKAKELFAKALMRARSTERAEGHCHDQPGGVPDATHQTNSLLHKTTHSGTHKMPGRSSFHTTCVRGFSTSAALAKDKKSDCNKALKLPCLQSTDIGGKKTQKAGGDKSVCEKFCMPCCKPARDPPLCLYPYDKPPCERVKPPRPAYSECRKIFEPPYTKPCECIPQRAVCRKENKAAGSKCSG